MRGGGKTCSSRACGQRATVDGPGDPLRVKAMEELRGASFRGAQSGPQLVVGTLLAEGQLAALVWCVAIKWRQSGILVLEAPRHGAGSCANPLPGNGGDTAI